MVKKIVVKPWIITTSLVIIGAAAFIILNNQKKTTLTTEDSKPLNNETPTLSNSEYIKYVWGT
jgi:hypothetical protein